MKKKKSKKFNKVVPILLIVLSLFIILFLFLGLIRKFDKGDYRVESRVKNIEKAKVKDADGIKTVGWLRVQGTNIDYPVIYAPGVDLNYRTQDFVWTENNFDSLNNMVYISGHNIKNLSKTPLIADKSHSRFEQLMSFVYLDFIEKNQYIQYTFNGENYLYKIYSVYFDDINNLDLYNSEKYSATDLNSIIGNSLDKNIYVIDTDINEKDIFISLNTCTRMFGDQQLIVNARLVRNGEEVKLSKVKKSSNYVGVNNVLKGGNSDEA